MGITKLTNYSLLYLFKQAALIYGSEDTFVLEIQEEIYSRMEGGEGA